MSSARRHLGHSVNDRKLGLRELGAGAERKGIARGAVCTGLGSSVRSGFCGMAVIMTSGVSRSGIVI